MPPERDETIPPDLLESFRQIHASGRASLGAAGDAAKSMRTLLAADVSLARSAFGRTLAFTGIAIAFGASTWLLSMAALVVWLARGLGLHWSVALLLTAVASLLITVFAGWRAMRYFEHTRLKATRRQLARLGIGELADRTPTPASSQSMKEATHTLHMRDGDGAPIKNEQGIDVTPP